MKAWEKAAIVGGIGFFAFAFTVPIFRSGRSGGQTLAKFLYYHSVFNKSESLWLKPEELESLKRLASERSGQQN